MKSCQICPAHSARRDTEEVTLKNRYNADRLVHLKICPECRLKLELFLSPVYVTIETTLF